jgi:hypothetical protein
MNISQAEGGGNGESFGVVNQWLLTELFSLLSGKITGKNSNYGHSLATRA